MNKKALENEAKRISKELIKKNQYTESFDSLINEYINKKYIDKKHIISYKVIKILSNYIEIASIDPFSYNYLKKDWI